MSDTPKAVWEGTLRISDIDLRCAVLDDGRRVIRAEDCERLMATMANGSPCDEAELKALARWLRGEAP